MEVPLGLTTSKYYIPSGRCIQAINYKHSRGGYLEHVPDSLTKVFHTANGRIVRDGGGINPDVKVLPDSLPNIAFYLANSGMDSTEVMTNWVLNYIKQHKSFRYKHIYYIYSFLQTSSTIITQV